VFPYCGSSFRLRQKYTAKRVITAGSTAPNSSIYHAVLPVLRVTGVKIACTNRLWLACNMAPVHALPDFRRIQAKMKLAEMTRAVKQINAYQVAVPEL